MKTKYYNWANRIHVLWDMLLRPDYESLLYSFTYHNVKTGKETTKGPFTFQQATRLAESRREDGRYKNFEFYID